MVGKPLERIPWVMIYLDINVNGLVSKLVYHTKFVSGVYSEEVC